MCRLCCWTSWTLFLGSGFTLLSGEVTELDHPQWGDFRMLEGDVPNSGTIEMFTNDGFETFCDRLMSLPVAMMICRSLGLPRKNVTLNNLSIEPDEKTIRCDGDEQSLGSCSWMVLRNISFCNSPQGISCGGKVRMHYGNNVSSTTGGRVEVYHDNQWKKVCGDARTADFRLARVMCGEMDDFQYMTSSGNLYDVSDGPFVSVSCSGDETTHEDCSITAVPSCARGFAVECNGTDFQLETSLESYSEDIQTVFFNTWRRCDWETGTLDEQTKQVDGAALASVVCHQIGFARKPAKIIYLGQNDIPTILMTVRCSGQEDSVEECIARERLDTTDPFCFAKIGRLSVECTDALSLVGGDSDQDGWLNKWNFLQSELQPVSGPLSTTHLVAKVVCRQLGFESGISKLMFKVTYSRLPRFNITQYVCNGMEKTLQHCEQRTFQGWFTADFGQIGVDCNAASNADVRPTEFATTFLIESFKDADNKLPDVLCHSLAYQRSTVDASIGEDNVTGVEIPGLTKKWCVGIEDTVDQCHDIYTDTPGVKVIQHITCHNSDECQTGYAVPTVDREITCHVASCRNDVCFPYPQSPCRGGCEMQLTLFTFGNIRKLESFSCPPSTCEPLYEQESTHTLSRQCCFSDYCNYNSPDPLTSQIAGLHFGRYGKEGVYLMVLDGNDVGIEDDYNIPEDFLIFLCRESGYVTHWASRIHLSTEQLATSTMCVTIENYTNCREFSTKDANCGGTLKPCVDKALAIDCNPVSPPFRLMDGPSENIGRLEVYIDDTWGTVCGQGFTPNATDVICRTLGFPGGCSSHWLKSPFKRTDLPVHMTDIGCHGNEKSIWYCNSSLEIPPRHCDHDHDIAIMCQSGSAPEQVFTPPPSTTLEPRTDYDDEVRCYEGECKDEGCINTISKNSLTSATVCSLGQDTNCYIQGDVSRDSMTPSRLLFGCTKTCDERSTNSSINHCCASDFCNVDTLMAIVQNEISNGSPGTPRILALSGLTALLTLFLTDLSF